MEGRGVTRSLLLKQSLLALALSAAFLFSEKALASEILGQLPSEQAAGSRPVIHGRGVRHDANGNRVGHFRCGLTQRLYFNLPPKFNLALNWATLPHVSPQPGAVVVQRRKGHALGGGPGGHVSRIVSVINSCRAVVTDEKGTYERDICKNLVAYVRPE